MKRYIVLDTETGGFEGTSLLTVFFSVLDENFKEVDHLLLEMKPKDGIYNVTAEALRVNGIDLKLHDARALTYEEAGRKLYDFLNGNSVMGQNKLLPIGHNVAFDIQKILEFIISKGTWNKFVSYRLRDTGSLASSCIDAGLLPASVSGSLTSLAEHFNIDASQAHTADGDVLMTAMVYERLVELIRNVRRSL